MRSEAEVRARLEELGVKFAYEGIEDGSYECHGCKGEKDLIYIDLPNLCNQNLCLCVKCVEKLGDTLTDIKLRRVLGGGGGG